MNRIYKDRALTVSQVSEISGYSRSYLYKLRKLERIPYEIVNNSSLKPTYRFSEKAIYQWLSLDSGFEKNLKKTVDLNQKVGDAECRRLSREMRGQSKSRRCFGNGFVTKRETKKGTSFYINYYDYDKNGKRVRIEKVVKDATSKADAWAALREKNLELLSKSKQNAAAKTEITFEDLTKEYLELHQEKRSIEQYRLKINAYLNPFFGDMLLHRITPYDVQKFVAERKQNGNGKNNGSPNGQTLNLELSLLRLIYSWAIKSRKFVVSENPVIHRDHFSKVNGSRDRVLSVQEEKILMKQLEDWQKDIVKVALHTGMRKGEIEKLEIDDVDFENNTILIREENNKSKRDDVIPMNPIVREILSRHVKRNSGGKSEFVFTHRSQKQHWDYCQVKNSDRWFRAACRRVGIEDMQFRDLRTTFATRCVEAGVTPFVLQKLMRHKDIRLTQKFYVKVNSQLLQEGVEKLAEFYTKQWKTSGKKRAIEVEESPNYAYLQ